MTKSKKKIENALNDLTEAKHCGQAQRNLSPHPVTILWGQVSCVWMQIVLKTEQKKLFR